MSHKVLSDFIKIYENAPCLWQVSCKEYYDRIKKDSAYAKLTDKLREIEPNATKDSVIKKINNIRSAYRKEKRKVKESMRRLGASAHSVYRPKLWYFPLLSFLPDQETPRTSRSNLDREEDVDGADEENASETDVLQIVPCHQGLREVSAWLRNDHFVNQEPQKNKVQNVEEIAQEGGYAQYSEQGSSSEPQSSRSQTPQARLRKKNRSSHFKEDLANEHCKKRPRTEEDRFDAMGKTFAIKLRGLPKVQMLIAEKLMNETLFQAEMGYLTMSHRLVGEENPHHSSTCLSSETYQDTSASTPFSMGNQRFIPKSEPME